MTQTQQPATRWQEQRAAQNVNQREHQLEDVRQKLHQLVIHELGPLLTDQRVSESELRRQVDEQLLRALSQERFALTVAERQVLVQSVTDDVLGYGPIDPLLRDDSITEIMVNGPDLVYVERSGKLVETDVKFVDETHARRIIDKIVSQVGRRVDEANPMCDARLPDGSRVNVIVHPLAIGGPFMTIRKFSKDPYTVEDLIGFGSFTPQVAHFINQCVKGRLNVVVSGGTGTGKTTLLNVLSSFIPTDERIVTVEDAKELQLHQQHVLPMEARPPNIEGKGEVKIRDLVRNSLRMRPDRIVVGEIRGGEALDMLQAMNTGHDGSITTVHSNSPRDTLSRIETLTLMAGMDLPVRVIREQMASALDMIVHLTRLRDGTRRVTHVTEVMGMEGDVVVLQDIYTFDFADGHRRGGPLPRWTPQHRHPPVVLGEAERLRHPARTLAVRRAAGCPRSSAPVSALAAATVLAATSDSPAKLVFALLIAAGVLGLGLALVLMSGDSKGKIERRLSDLLQEPGVVTEEGDDDFVPQGDQALAETALMQRMVGITGRLADRAGLLSRTEDALEQADLPLRPPEALFFYFAGLFVVGMLGLLVLPIPMALGLALVAGIGPVISLHRRRGKRLREFQAQLPATLNLLSGSMRAGFSFAQGLESVADEASEPTRRELQRVFTESRLGRPIEDALEDSANRMTSVDLMWAVMAIRIQREVGGNLAELLDTVSDTMTQRERLRLEIRALTAEGRFSGWILGLFPIVFAGVLYMIQPDYMGVLFSESFGIMAIIACGVMTFFGFIWLRKILQIEV